MTRTIQTLIVDDERYAREELKHLLASFPDIKIIAEAISGEDAIVKATQHQPDVVFLDIEMPKITGMEVAKLLQGLKKAPLIVFATAYPQFAAEAFRIDAIDYLLKPYDEEQIQQTVNRIAEKLATPTKKAIPDFGKLAVELDGEIHYILPKEILYIYRDDNVSKIITTKGKYDVKLSLKELENRLSAYSLFRIHKSFLVNLNYVSRLTPWFHGAYQLELEGSEEKLSVSRNYVKGLRDRLEL